MKITVPEQPMQQFDFEPSYRREDRGISVLDVSHIPLPVGFNTEVPARIIYMRPGAWGGNHRHGRREVWVAYGKGMYLLWRDARGRRHEAAMTSEDGHLYAFAVAPNVPHKVENRGTEPGLLYELIDIDDGPATPLEGDELL